MDRTPESHQSWSNPGEQILTLFKAIQKIYKEQLFEKTRQYGFTGPQLGLIIALHKKPYATLSEMSKVVGLSKSTVSGIVDRLVAQGVVIREVPEDNRRIIRLSLSQEFCRRNMIMELKNKYISDALKNASAEDLGKIIAGLDVLYTLMKKNRTEGPAE